MALSTSRTVEHAERSRAGNSPEVARTEDQDELHVVLGASGGIGNTVVRELARRGHTVRAVNRSGNASMPAGVQRLAADVSARVGAERACAGAAVVYYCTQPPYTRWAEEFLAMTNAVLAGAKGAKIVFADNLYLYGPVAGALTEDLPSRATGRKGRVRAAVAKRLLIAHRSGEVRVTIGRASDYYGPGGLNSAVGERLFEPILEGGRASWLGRADAPHTLHYLEDIARGLVTLGERREADGEVWHLPAAPALTGRDFVDLIAETVGRPVRMRTTSSGMVRFAGIFSPFVREVRETMYQWQNPFVIDSSKFEHAFGPAKTTNHREAVARTVDWFKQELARAGRSSPK